MKTTTSDKLATLIAGFYAETYGERIVSRDDTSKMLALFARLQQQAFPGYLFQPAQFLTQAKTQLVGNRKALHNYHPLSFRFAPLSGQGEPMVIDIGVMEAEPNNILGIRAENPATNDRIQSVLEMVSREDTIS